MPETKKLLVAFNPDAHDVQSSDFLIPWSLERQPVFHGLKSGKDCVYGMMVFLGRAISENDLFAKLVDSGAIINSVDSTLATLRNYIDQLQTLKLGNVVRIVPDTDASFGLELVSKTPSGARS